MSARLFAAGLLLALVQPALGQEVRVQLGADLLFSERIDLVKGKKIGLLTNHTALLSDGRHLADVLTGRDDMELVALFGPEHGIRGDTTGPIRDGVDPATGVPVYSLYGKTKKPTARMLEGLDLILFDVQDVGARFYTYISTMGHVMGAAAKKKIPFVVLDRPNPITGARVEGPVAEDSMLSIMVPVKPKPTAGATVEGPVAVDSTLSLVTFAPIPIMHGMTVGELAMMYNGQGYLEDSVRAHLTVVRMKNWTRDLWYDETGIQWVNPSPNMLTLRTALVYPGTCLFEGVNVSEGRGTDKPFEYIGAPWLNTVQVIELLENASLPGVKFEPIQFTPTKRPKNVTAPKFTKQGCNGIRIEVTEREEYQAVRTGIVLLWAIRMIHPERLEWKGKTFDLLAGTTIVRSMLERGRTPDQVIASWHESLQAFKEVRQKYLLYP
ncbi:MAG: DUF1343 domain-containing protein [Bacteroidota bacterium]